VAADDNCGTPRITVVLNGRAQGSYTMSNLCSCNTCITSPVLGGNVLDFNPSGTNTITIRANNAGAYVGYVQVCIEYLE
jgi:hypothetical protein